MAGNAGLQCGVRRPGHEVAEHETDATLLKGKGMTYLEGLRNRIEAQYKEHPTGCGGSFGELLCYEIHEGGLTFNWLAIKWGISVTALGELIYDHCKHLEQLPVVDHDYRRD